MDFEKNIILENEIVKLLPLQHTHIEDLRLFSENEPELWKYSLMTAAGIDNLEKYINKALSDRKKETSYPFVVFDKKYNTIVGSTRFYDFQKAHKTIQLGYTWYGNKYQGTGINKNCKFLMLNYAFENLKLERVEFRADATNNRSIAAMKSIGCTVEGILRSNCKAQVGRRDSIILSILKNEWKQKLKNNLLNKIQNLKP